VAHDVVRCRQVLFERLRPHGNQAVAEYDLVRNCERLKIHHSSNKSEFLTGQTVIVTYLIIASYEFGNGVSQALTRELLRAPDLLDYPVKVSLLFNFFSSPYRFHLLPDCARYRPMMFRYVCLFTSFLVQVVVLPYMMTAGRVATGEKCLDLAMFLDKFCITPNTRFR
jgi:hypothetical protein